MSDQYDITPRVIIARHGQTDWARVGRFTGTTDIELTQKGIGQISTAAATLVGAGKLLDPRRLTHIYVSPRTRAVETFKLLLPQYSDFVPGKVTFTEDIAEWDYGNYEGLKDMEIRNLRKMRGLDGEREWNIWTDGCEDGESSQQVTERLDKLILQIKEIQKPYMRGEKPADVLVVAHGLILRAFAKRWINWSIDRDLPMEIQPGGIAVLSYKDNDTNKPTLNLGLALP
ncbi:putative phosphoglycerate mutase [Macroventuria anomochaeta]|uniref:Phosphoglycerate mutase n=1 Tax=Macroventuria anomochaeta TaxID=301207 RepID=A0ACB6RSX6_9PLEO|nr:putative phosphoglycerate mutase [Macroventuria anomochaeta]KAF2624874.1 putative phosphoglycerate mutase [Macroventuria anomochaeta]